MIEPRANVTKELILSKITEQNIFEKYLGISIDDKLDGHLFCNPLRNDKYPTCSIKKINNNLRFRDWSESRGYNCFDLVMKITNCTYNESLLLISHHFSLLEENYNAVEFKYVLEPTKIIELVKSISKPTEIRIKRTAWTKKHLDYWKQYNLHLEDLVNVFPVSVYWINDNKFTPNNITFAYHFGNYDYKLYFPLANKGEIRFLHNNSNILQGEYLLQFNKSVLLITSSYKDVLVLNKIAKVKNLDYTSIAPMSESTPINKEKLAYLRKKYDYVIYYYNSDKQGIEAATQQSTENNMLMFYNPIDIPKDISDVVKYNGFDYACNLIKNLTEEYFLPF